MGSKNPFVVEMVIRRMPGEMWTCIVSPGNDATQTVLQSSGSAIPDRPSWNRFRLFPGLRNLDVLEHLRAETHNVQIGPLLIPEATLGATEIWFTDTIVQFPSPNALDPKRQSGRRLKINEDGADDDMATRPVLLSALQR